MSDYEAYFGFDKEAAKKELEERAKKRGDNVNNDNPNKLQPQDDLYYHIFMLPYIHGPAGVPPILEMYLHYGMGRGFACRYKQFGEKCPVDWQIKLMWDKYKEYKETKGKGSTECATVLKAINKINAVTRWYSPVWVYDVTDKAGNRVDEEYNKYCLEPRPIWWDFPQGIQENLTEGYGIYGSLHNPKNPIMIKLIRSKEAAPGKNQVSYTKPKIFIVQGKYEIDLPVVMDMIGKVVIITDANLFEVLSEEEIEERYAKYYHKKSDSAERPSLDTESSASDEVAQNMADQDAEDPFAIDATTGVDDSFKQEVDAIFDDKEEDETQE